jgi:hypothetical protein
MDRADTTEHVRSLAKVEAKLFDPADADDPRWVQRWVQRMRARLARRYRSLERRAVEQGRKARKEARTAGRFWH